LTSSIWSSEPLTLMVTTWPLRLTASPQLGEVFNRLWTTATVSATEAKRGLLAQIAVAALNGMGDDALLDELLVLADTTENLQPYHVELLARMARPRPGAGQMANQLIMGGWSLAELQRVHPEAGTLLAPLLGALESFWLVENVGTGTYDNTPSWSVTEYGQRLLTFLASVAMPQESLY
jgi:hypothetical protein